MLVILTFQTSYMFKSTPTLCFFITYTTHDEQGVTISNSDLEFQGHPLRSSDKILIIARSVASNRMKSTLRFSLYQIYNQNCRSSYTSQLDLDFEGQLSRTCD